MNKSSIVDKILYDAGDYEEIQVTLRLKEEYCLCW